MTKPDAHKKHTPGRSWNLSPIVKQVARVVGYLLASLALVAAVSSCAATWEPFNCKAPEVVCDL